MKCSPSATVQKVCQYLKIPAQTIKNCKLETAVSNATHTNIILLTFSVIFMYISADYVPASQYIVFSFVYRRILYVKTVFQSLVLNESTYLYGQKNQLRWITFPIRVNLLTHAEGYIIF